MRGVPEYDAFGREIGDDPLKPFRPSATPAPPEPAPRLAPIRPRAPRRRRGGTARLVLILAVLAAGLFAVGNVGVKVEGGIQDVVDGMPSTEVPAQRAVTGIGGDSLIRKENFANAVATLAGAGLGRPLTMRVAPDRIDATLIASGRLHQVQITPGGELNELASGDAAPGRTIAYKAIDTSAPERLVRAGATKKVLARRIDYLVITAGPPVGWGAYYKGGRVVLGDAHGRKQGVL
jgi:hypothetical protein